MEQVDGMRILINLTKNEINALGQIMEIRDENDIIFCLHELIGRMGSDEK